MLRKFEFSSDIRLLLKWPIQYAPEMMNKLISFSFDRSQLIENLFVGNLM